MTRWIRYTDIRTGDRIRLAGQPATVLNVHTSRGYHILDFQRDTGTRGRSYGIGSPVELLSRRTRS